MLPVTLITKAGDAPDQLTDAERLSAGHRLRHRHRRAARPARRPQPAAAAGRCRQWRGRALALAQALETRDAATAYAYALPAAETGRTACRRAARPDRGGAALRRRCWSCRPKRVEGVEHPAAALSSLALIRDEAAMRLTGRGADPVLRDRRALGADRRRGGRCRKRRDPRGDRRAGAPRRPRGRRDLGGARGGGGRACPLGLGRLRPAGHLRRR